MRPIRRSMGGICLVAFAPVMAAAQGPAPSGVWVRSHAVAPQRVEMGAEARERLTLWAPDGVRLAVRDAAGPEQAVERLGSWSTEREADPAGGVTWRFDVPLVAWTAGEHATPALAVLAGGRTGDGTTFRVEGIVFSVTSPLPGDQRRLSPAPAEGPPAPAPAWLGLLAVLPATLAMGAVGAAVAWRRAVGRAASRGAEAAPGATPPPTLETVLAHLPPDAAARAVAVSDAVRVHPALVRVGVRDAHATPEVLARVTPPLDGIAELLALADAVKFAGLVPGDAPVDAAVGRAVEALRHG